MTNKNVEENNVTESRHKTDSVLHNLAEDGVITNKAVGDGNKDAASDVDNENDILDIEVGDDDDFFDENGTKLSERHSNRQAQQKPGEGSIPSTDGGKSKSQNQPIVKSTPLPTVPVNLTPSEKSTSEPLKVQQPGPESRKNTSQQNCKKKKLFEQWDLLSYFVNHFCWINL